MKGLIVNADDFGFTHDVNRGIIEARRNGILTATTLMAEAPAFDDAVRLAREEPSLDVGCHLVLVGLPGYPATVSELIEALALRRIRPYERLRAQIQRILDAGIRPLHLDTHKHTHLLPPVLDAVARLADEFDIRWIRRPFDFQGHPGQTSTAGRLMTLARPWFRRAIARYRLRATDHFAGFRATGRFDAESLAEVIRALPDGVTEFMCHPGFCTDELRAARTRLKECRERELRALTDPRARAALEESGVVLYRYRDSGALNRTISRVL